jgi:hypothetical protein
VAVFNLFFSTILLPLITIVLLWRRPRRPLSGWITTLIMAAGVTGFSVLVAPWGWFGVPVRFAIALLFVIALIVSLRRPIPETPPEDSAIRMFVKVLVGMFFGAVAVGALRARSVPPNPIDLAFPLKGGTYLVAHGGSGPAANLHAQDAKQRYAVDFVKLNAAGMRARGIHPADPSAHAIFGAAVVAPCDGTVVAAVDQFADASPDPKNPLGNHVALRCGDAMIYLAQLQRGSIAVRNGMRVGRGTLLARAGHSGLSIEPHLHVHAERNDAAVPVTFEGRWLVRNDMLRR